jgi:hypothetical protein
MFGHNHISEDDEIVAQADFFESFQKQVAMARAAEQRPPLITTAGDHCCPVELQGAGCK